MLTLLGNTAAGIILMLSGVFLKRNKVNPNLLALIFSLVTLGLAVFQKIMPHLGNATILENSLAFDPQNTWLIIGLHVLFFIYLLINYNEINKVEPENKFELFALLFFIMAGITVICSFTNLLMFFLGIEIVSIPLYILTGSDKRNLKSNEASLKYFLMGAFSTAIMLMGIVMLYGGSDSGSFNISDITISNDSLGIVSSIGIVLIIIAMSFKVSAVPFHFWTPDVYDGAPTVFTGFMASIVKGAALFAFYKLFIDSLDGITEIHKQWSLLFGLIIAATLIVGNITAVFQQSVKRMLSYSSIAQAGFILLNIYALKQLSADGKTLTDNELVKESIVVYIIGYCLASIALFAVINKMKDYSIDGFNGLAKTKPEIAFAVAICLLSLTGIPLTIGFQGKFMSLLSAVYVGKNYWLIVIALIFAAVSAYYYFKVIQAMFFKSPETEVQINNSSATFEYTLLGIALLIIVLGIIPSLLTEPLYLLFD